MQNLQDQSSFLIVSSQNGHNFIFACFMPINDARDLNIPRGMVVGVNAAPQKVVSAGYSCLLVLELSKELL